MLDTKNVLNYRKPAFWILIAAAIGCVTAAICFLTDPATADISDETPVAEEKEPDNDPGTIRLELDDIDGNGENEYVIYTGEYGIYPYLTFYLNGEAVFERDGSALTAADIGDLVAFEDVDGDLEKEIVLTMLPHVNSMPLMEYAVLKKKDGRWSPLEVYRGENISDNTFPVTVTKGEGDFDVIISCKGLEKQISYDFTEFYRSRTAYPEEDEDADDTSVKWISSCADEIKNASAGDECGSTCAWGVWNISLSVYDNHTCIVAQQGLQGYDRQDFWGDIYLYFDYDSDGKIRMLDMDFKPSREAEDAKARKAYLQMLSGDFSLCKDSQVAGELEDTIFPAGNLEYTEIDLDGDGVSELLLQWRDAPGYYNGVFHYDGENIICWQHDAVEMNCYDYPLLGGKMVQQYDYNPKVVK